MRTRARCSSLLRAAASLTMSAPVSPVGRLSVVGGRCSTIGSRMAAAADAPTRGWNAPFEKHIAGLLGQEAPFGVVAFQNRIGREYGAHQVSQIRVRRACLSPERNSNHISARRRRLSHSAHSEPTVCMRRDWQRFAIHRTRRGVCPCVAEELDQSVRARQHRRFGSDV